MRSTIDRMQSITEMQLMMHKLDEKDEMHQTKQQPHTDERVRVRVLLHRQKSVKITNNSNSNGIRKRYIWFGIHTCARAIQVTTTIVNFTPLNRTAKKMSFFWKGIKTKAKQNKTETKSALFCYLNWNNSSKKVEDNQPPMNFEIYFTPTTYKNHHHHHQEEEFCLFAPRSFSHFGTVCLGSNVKPLIRISSVQYEIS